MAVIVNDMSEVNIDAALVEKIGGAEQSSRTEEKLVNVERLYLKDDFLKRLQNQEGRL